jgi:4-amino-4-deoxy-L-arabinose transferase-like glycosyltransferase
MIGDFLFLIILALFSIAQGGCFWRLATGQWPKDWQRPALAMPLGLGLSGLILGLFAAWGHFHAGLVLVVLISLIALFCYCLNHKKSIKLNLHQFQKNIFPGWSRWLWLLLVCVGWLGLHAPVTDGDALCYHLEVAKRMAQNGSVRFDPDLHETAYPLLVESLQATALHLRGPVATRSISFLFGLSLSASAIMLARPLTGTRNGIWAGILLLSVPIVNCGMIAPLNDVPLAAFCAAALVALSETSLGRRQQVALCALYCGLACGVKFPGIVWSGVMGLLILSQSWHFLACSNQKIRLFGPSLLFVSVLICSGSFWYVRAAILTGNPVHPYFKNTFGGHGLDEVLLEDHKTPLEQLWNISTAPIGLALVPGHFDSFSHQIGPLFLALIPIGFLSRMPRSWYLLLGIGWLEMAICLTQRQSPRFYIATLAPWSAAAASVWVHFLRTFQNQPSLKSGRIVAGVIFCLFLTTLSFNLARVRHSAFILAGFISPSGFLVEQEPTARLATWVNANLPANAKLIGQDHRGFYWPRSFTMEKAHRRRTGLLQNADGPEVILTRLRSAGFTHLVMAEPDPMDAVEFDQDLSNALNSQLAYQMPLLDQTIHEPDGYNRRYRIYAIETTRLINPQELADDCAKQDKALIRTGSGTNP